MGILKITYLVFILFLSGIGSFFKYKRLETKKKSFDDKYTIKGQSNVPFAAKVILLLEM